MITVYKVQKVKQKEIDDLFKRIDEYRNVAWEDLHTMKNLLMNPVYEKVNKTISTLGCLTRMSIKSIPAYPDAP